MSARMLLAVALALSSPAFAQTPDIPRTPEGKPDFQGVWRGNTTTPLERFPSAAGLNLSTVEANAILTKWRASLATEGLTDPDFLQQIETSDETSLLRIGGQYRSSQVIDPPDGKLPYTAEGRKLLAQQPANGFGFEGPEQRTVSDRCLTNTGRAPLTFPVYPMPRRIVQTGEALVILSEYMGELRIIPIGPVRSTARLPSIAGDSLARWEGDTLVVETSGMRTDRGFQRMIASSVLLGPETRVSEQFEFAGPDELFYRYTLEDPAFYERPWTVEMVMTRSDEAMHESACHEGNYSMTNMLLGAREAERRAEAAAGKPKAAGQ